MFAFAGNSPFLLVDALGLWKKEAGSETIWSAEKNDTLESLAVNEGRNKGDYVCIWPTEGTRDHGYPRKIKPCDKYDVSNLRLPEQENSVELLRMIYLIAIKTFSPVYVRISKEKTLQNFYKKYLKKERNLLPLLYLPVMEDAARKMEMPLLLILCQD